jgi:serine/threonine protein kinase
VSDAAATVTAGVMGTLAYMAPEQRSGQPASIASDVYGAGALFWHALTGAPPSEALPPLSSELEPVHLSIAKKLIAPEAERPADTHAARALLGSVKWPTVVPPARPARLGQRAASERPRSQRLEPIGGPLFRDTLLDRTLLLLPADPPTLARVLPFARADDPLLPQVLAYTTEEKSFWVEQVEGAPLERPLTAGERESLARALGRLHRAGGVHGRIDAQHLVVRGGVVALTFALEPSTASADDDLLALTRL